MSVRIVEVDSDAGEDEIRRLVAGGAVVAQAGLAGLASLFVHDPTTGRIDEISPDEHEQYVEIGTIHGRPVEDDEEDLDGDGFLEGWVGRLGSHYFQKNNDPMGWEHLGELDSDDEAFEMACGAEFDFERY